MLEAVPTLRQQQTGYAVSGSHGYGLDGSKIELGNQKGGYQVNFTSGRRASGKKLHKRGYQENFSTFCCKEFNGVTCLHLAMKMIVEEGSKTNPFCKSVPLPIYSNCSTASDGRPLSQVADSNCSTTGDVRPLSQVCSYAYPKCSALGDAL